MTVPTTDAAASSYPGKLGTGTGHEAENPRACLLSDLI